MSCPTEAAAAYPFKTVLAPVRDAWYVLAYSGEVTTTPLERWFLDEPVVLYRTMAGRVVALDATCPHRGHSLGRGRVLDDCIECPYHGLRFGGDGACVHIPSQAEAPPRMRTRTYAVHEIAGWVWLWAGNALDAAPFPELPGIADSENWVIDVRLYAHVKARAQLMNDNLLDLTHVSFLHSDSIGSPDVAATTQDCEYGHRFASSRRYVKNASVTPALAAAWGIEGPVDRELVQTFHLPAIHCGFDRFLRCKEAGTPDAGDALACRRNFHAVTPATMTTSHYFFARASERVSTTRPPISIDYQRLIDQDIEAVELIEARLGMGIVPRDVSVRADGHALRTRRILESWGTPSEHVLSHTNLPKHAQGT
jgi:vanillate O-demethylase monooxygenase subunit